MIFLGVNKFIIISQKTERTYYYRLNIQIIDLIHWEILSTRNRIDTFDYFKM